MVSLTAQTKLNQSQNDSEQKSIRTLFMQNGPKVKKPLSNKLATTSVDAQSNENRDITPKEYFMSVGSAGNKSHPQDAVNAWIYNSFNEPVRTFSWIQLAALVTFVSFCIFSTLQRT